MKALQYTAPNVFGVNEIDVPDIQADEVLVAARSVGICHSDVDLLEGRYIIPFDYPIIPGHEWSGEVIATGSKVAGLHAGDRVVGECVIGLDHFGFSISGAAAEYFVAKESWLHKLADNVDWTAGAFVEPFSCGYYATLKVDNLDASDTAIVFGAGPIGLGTVAAAAAKGARVIIAEPTKSRADIALEMGAEHVVDPTADDFLDAVQELTGGRGADVVFEASGRPVAMASALEVAGFQARLAFIGIDVGQRASAQLGLIQSKELQIRGTIGSPGVWPETIRFLSRTGIDLSRIVTSTFPLGQGDEALRTVLTDKTQIKVHMTSTAS